MPQYSDEEIINYAHRTEKVRAGFYTPITPVLPYIASDSSPQQLWEDLKVEIKRLMRSFGRHQASWRKSLLERLHVERERLLDSINLPAGCHVHPRLSIVENQIEQLLNTTTFFYTTLFTTDPINHDHVLTLTDTIPDTDKLCPDDTMHLEKLLNIGHIFLALQRCPRQSFPDIDGLPYSVLRLIATHKFLVPLMLKVFNDAFFNNKIPTSWNNACMSLLPKSGDLTSLYNWRPISLLNTDAKTFPRIINRRLMNVFSSRISFTQMGFMPARFIGENGRLLQLMVYHANQKQDKDIGMYIDQSKAYDRVQPQYLDKVLHAFGVPTSYIHSIANIFFATNIHINLNGNITSPFTASRSLRQGKDPQIHGYLFLPNPTLTSLAPVKILAYADDAIVFLHNQNDFDRLQVHLSTYSSVSNDLLNMSKTEVLPLSGTLNTNRKQFLQPFNIPKCISFQTCCLRRTLGGLGVIDPIIQSIKLQWGWLTPLLLTFPSSPVDTDIASPTNRISIPYSNPRFRPLLSLHVFKHDTTTSKLRCKNFTSTDLTLYPGISKRVLNNLNTPIIRTRPLLQKFFYITTPLTQYQDSSIDLTPTILSMFMTNNFSLLDTDSLSGNIRTLTMFLRYRSHPFYACPCAPSLLPTHIPNFLYPLSSTKWNCFWRLAIHLRARTIWFGLIHNRIPHSSLLHHQFPSRFTSPLCTRCQSEPDVAKVGLK
ncbi:hypothetical protein INT47_006939 [Mucor saturninus]|uniref:Reverse transcriptase domain-containing protein n=1 Tax=Mucor saturninus TaxID=64648 RepID=A0A8H7QRB5_9FUNG|nr:hypothetical protein INT47_006939 [Mucor saturninus]